MTAPRIPHPPPGHGPHAAREDENMSETKVEIDAAAEVRRARADGTHPVANVLIMEVAEREGLDRAAVAAAFTEALHSGEITLMSWENGWFQTFDLPAATPMSALQALSDAATISGRMRATEQSSSEWYGLQDAYSAIGTAFEKADAEFIAAAVNYVRDQLTPTPRPVAAEQTTPGTGGQ